MNFNCPYCNHPTTITDPNYFNHWEYIKIAQSDRGNIGFNLVAVTCPNRECHKLYLKAQLTKARNAQDTRWTWVISTVIKDWQLLPESEARVLPEYIPVPIREDYYEACRIRDLSPKASATLSRRCLQGMIRDFWKISKATLKGEVDSLEEKVDSLTWDAIDAVRQVGNIGAHMEKDINTIVEVDPKEAQLLIGLIEQLIDDWYIERHEKETRLRTIKEMAETKKKEKGGE